MSQTDQGDLLAMADAAVATFPDAFRTLAQGVLVRVADWPPQNMLDELQIENRLELTGLYDGIPMPFKSAADPAPMPDMIWLFREPILAEWRDRGDVALQDLVAHVIVHEFAHHFGWSDDDIAEIDKWWL